MKVPHQTLGVINSALFIVHVHHRTPAEFTQEVVEECKCQVSKAAFQSRVWRGQTWICDTLTLPAGRAKGMFLKSQKSKAELAAK